MGTDNPIHIVRASFADIAVLAPLFDQYRIFYGQTTDLSSAEIFLKQRFLNEESIVFLANMGTRAVGFTQLYTTFSSVSLQSFFILNDLYVAPEYRGRGLGKALLIKAQEYCISQDYKGLALETATDNPAQGLYNKLGWKKDTEYVHYFWTAPA